LFVVAGDNAHDVWACDSSDRQLLAMSRLFVEANSF